MRKFKKLSPEYQETLKRIGAESMKKLLAVIKADNLKAEEILEKNGVRWTPQPDQENLKKFQQVGLKARKSLSGKMFPPELLRKVLGYLAEIQ